MICCKYAYNVSLTQLYPPYFLGQILGFRATCGVKMMWLCHGWGLQPPQTSSHIHIRHIQSVWAHWYAVNMYTISALHRYSPYLAQIMGFWVTCGVKMMWLCHGWGWQQPQTSSHIHISHLQSIWAHWYAIHWYTVGALHSFTHSNRLRFWSSGSLVVVESKWCH